MSVEPVSAIPPRFLVVDDEDAIREELMDWLLLRGTACAGAENAAAAMRALAADPAITVLLTDISMPGTDGIRLALDALASRGEAEAIEVVVLTANPSAEHAVAALRARAVDFVAKPPQPAQLAAALARAHEGAVRRRLASRREQDMLAQLEQSVRALREATSGTPALPEEVLSLMRHEIISALYQILGISTLIRDAVSGAQADELRGHAQSMLAAGMKLSERTRALLRAAGQAPGTG